MSTEAPEVRTDSGGPFIPEQRPDPEVYAPGDDTSHQPPFHPGPGDETPLVIPGEAEPGAGFDPHDFPGPNE